MVSVVQRLDVVWRKDSDSSMTAPSPAQRTGAVQQVDDVTTQEVEVGGLSWGVVTEGVSQARFPRNWFLQTWGGLSRRVRGVRGVRAEAG